jgi:hypothetical protein
VIDTYAGQAIYLTWHSWNQTGIKIPMSKSQIPNNFQSRHGRDQIPRQIRFGHSKLEFGYCLGFGACPVPYIWTHWVMNNQRSVIFNAVSIDGFQIGTGLGDWCF